MNDRHGTKQKTEENNRQNRLLSPAFPWVLAVWQALRPVGNGLRHGVAYEPAWDQGRRLVAAGTPARRESVGQLCKQNVTTSQVTKYHYTSGQRMAMNKQVWYTGC